MTRTNLFTGSIKDDGFITATDVSKIILREFQSLIKNGKILNSKVTRNFGIISYEVEYETQIKIPTKPVLHKRVPSRIRFYDGRRNRAKRISK